MKRRLFAAALVVFCASPAAAQSLGDVARAAEEKRKAAKPSNALKFDDRDADPNLAHLEVAHFEVTQERWTRFRAADLRVGLELTKDAALTARLDALNPDTVRGMVRFINKEPVLAAAIKAAGSDPEEYSYTCIALLAAMIVSVDRPAPEVYAQLPAAMRANVALVEKHEKEVRGLATIAKQIRAGAEKQ